MVAPSGRKEHMTRNRRSREADERVEALVAPNSNLWSWENSAKTQLQSGSFRRGDELR